MESNNTTDRSLTADEALARLREELPSEYPGATKTRIDPAAPDQDSNWDHKFVAWAEGVDYIAACKYGSDPWAVDISIAGGENLLPAKVAEITSAIAAANRYIDKRRSDELAVEQTTKQESKADARHGILQKAIEAAPKWAIAPTISDMFGPVNGEIEVQYRGPNLAGEHDGWDTRAQLSQMVVFSLGGEILESLPVVPGVFIESARIDSSSSAHLTNVEALMKSGTALIRLATELQAAHADTAAPGE